MKNIKTFESFCTEAIIMPEKLERIDFKSFEHLVNWGKENNIDIVLYPEFIESLDAESIKSAPKPDPRAPFFALFHPVNKRPMFVIMDKNVIKMPFFNDAFFDIISHEMVHAVQHSKRDIEYILPDPTNKKEYLSNKDEIMAFSWTIANEIYNKNKRKSFMEIKSRISSDGLSRVVGQQGGQIYSDIKRLDKKEMDRYLKYIYLYLEELYKDNPGTKEQPKEIEEEPQPIKRRMMF